MQRKFLLSLLGFFVLYPQVFAKKQTTHETKPCVIIDSTKLESLEHTKRWEKVVFEKLCQSHFTDGWGLFDQGGISGWGSFGQIFVLGEKHGAKVFFVPLRGKEAEEKTSLKGKDLNSFQNSVQTLSAGLSEHWDEGFDMFEREFIHVKKSADHTLEVVQRVKWRFGRAKCEKHCDLAHAFESLIKGTSTNSQH